MYDDTELLHQYVEDGSHAAFRELVERHIQLVNSTARRKVAGDTHLAQDVTQLVFTDLARKAASLPRGVVLAGWLHRHTCFTAAKAVRAESRRRTRERTAMEMNILHDDSGYDAHWDQLAPVLDDALNHLGAEDRDAIVLRFLQRQDLRAVGQALGTSDDTAQKRVSRALEKLRGYLVRGGVTVASAAMLSSTLDAAVLAPVPVGLAATVSTTALSSAAISTIVTLTTIKTMLTSKFALGLATTVIIVGATTAIVAQNNPSPAPAPVSATSTSVPAAKTSIPQASVKRLDTATNQVVAPIMAPAPAGNAPATPNDAAASSPPMVVVSGQATTYADTGRLNFTRGAASTGTLTVNNAPDTLVAGTVTFITPDGVTHTMDTSGGATSISSTGSTTSFNPASVISVNTSGAAVGGTIIGSNGSAGTFSRKVQITGGQMTTTTTKNGVTTTTTRPAPPSGSIIPGATQGEPDTMTITDQNGVTHTMAVPIINSASGTGQIMIMTTPDGGDNILQITPDPANP